MHPDTLEKELVKEPFVPLRIRLSGGQSVEIVNPGLTYIVGTAFYILEPVDKNRPRSERVANTDPRIIALRHIVSIEPMKAAAA